MTINEQLEMITQSINWIAVKLAWEKRQLEMIRKS